MNHVVQYQGTAMLSTPLRRENRPAPPFGGSSAQPLPLINQVQHLAQARHPPYPFYLPVAPALFFPIEPDSRDARATVPRSHSVLM